MLRQQGLLEEAAELYRRVIDLPNQHADFLHRLTNAWCMQGLAEIYRVSDPDLAREYLEAIVASGVQGATLEDAERLVAALNADSN